MGNTFKTAFLLTALTLLLMFIGRILVALSLLRDGVICAGRAVAVI